MPELPDNNAEEARRWLRNVEGDLRSMRALEADDTTPGRIVCFLAHLVVEKSMKATLIDVGVPFQKTHDLVVLYDMCMQGSRLARLDTATIETLAPWAIDGRYADDLADAHRSLAHRMASFAEQVVADPARPKVAQQWTKAITDSESAHLGSPEESGTGLLTYVGPTLIRE